MERYRCGSANGRNTARCNVWCLATVMDLRHPGWANLRRRAAGSLRLLDTLHTFPPILRRCRSDVHLSLSFCQAARPVGSHSNFRVTTMGASSGLTVPTSPRCLAVICKLTYIIYIPTARECISRSRQSAKGESLERAIGACGSSDIERSN